ncbi:MAG: TolC family protein [Bdellovibrio sp.]|nr:TolC family protein [Bdellovibrio sp.]
MRTKSFLILLATTITKIMTLPYAMALEVERDGKHVHGAHIECPLPMTAQDVVRCAQEEHPEVKRVKLQRESLQTLIGMAEQRPNPALSSRFTQGKFLGDNIYESETSLLQPIELGDKRNARIDQAASMQRQSEAEIREVQADVIIKTILNLYRLKQIEHERAILDETILIFEKVNRQITMIPRRSPEQQASSSLFKMAYADAKIKRSELLDEERVIEHYFHLSTGHSLSELKNVLPDFSKTMPQVLDSSHDSTTYSPTIDRLLANHKFAETQLQLAQAQSWPDLEIGPTVQTETDGPFQKFRFGISLNIPLPIFQANGAGRIHANNSVTIAEKLISLEKAEESHERAEQMQIYRNAIEALQEIMPIQTIENEHDQIERLYIRGLVSSSVLVESHRQRFDLMRGRHGRELKATQALWLIYKLDGKIFEESL